MSYPTGSRTSAPKKPGTGGIVIGIILMVLSIPVGLGIIYAVVTSTPKALDSAKQFVGDGSSNQVSITDTTPMAIWVSVPGAVSRYSCQVTDPSGNDVALNYSPSHFVRKWSLYAVFTPSGSGTYTVACSSSTDNDGYLVYVVTPSIASSSPLPGVFGGIAVGFVMFAGGLVLIIRRPSVAAGGQALFGTSDAYVTHPMPGIPPVYAPYPGLPTQPQTPLPPDR